MPSSSKRVKDAFGFLRIKDCTITGEDVAKYLGCEVPDYKELGLDPDKFYDVYRPQEEIEKADFENTPLLSQHVNFSAKDYKYKYIKGTIGQEKMVGSEKKALVAFWDEKAIDDLEKGKKFLSAGYWYKPVMENGIHNGKEYQIRMTKIIANHVAMVDNPRYKKAMVADSDIEIPREETEMFFGKKEKAEFSLVLDAAVEEVKAILANDKMSDEEKEEAVEKVKEKAKKVKDSKCKEPKVEDEDPDDEDMTTTDKKKKKMTGDAAIDVQAIVKAAKEEAKAETLALINSFKKDAMAFDSAVREYERTSGKINKTVFDSAEGILDTILKNNKYSIEGKSLEAKQAMVEMLPALKKSDSAKITFDSNVGSKVNVSSEIMNFLKGSK